MDWHDLSNWCSRCGKPVTKAAHIHTCVPHPVIEDLRAQLAEAQRERDALTHDIERHIAIASEYATENAKLREFVAANDAYMRWKQGDGKRADGGELFDAMLEKRAAVGP